MTKRTKLNKMLGKYGQLRPDSLRYKFIQNLGYILWGRKLGYLSWWPHAARTAGALFFHDGKLLLGKRAATMPDRPNTYGLIGGFVDDLESFAEGLSREIKEECGLDIPPENFAWKNLFKINDGISSLKEQADFSITQVWFIYHLSQEQVESLTPTEEVTEFLWVDQDMIADLNAHGQLAFQEQRENIEAAFAEAGRRQKTKDGEPISNQT